MMPLWTLKRPAKRQQRDRSSKRRLSALKNVGFRDDQVGVAFRSQAGEQAPSTESEHTRVADGATTGAAAGAGIGALWALGIAAGILPAIGPIVAGGILGSLLASAAAGAVAGGLGGGARRHRRSQGGGRVL
jgi:hypothetical protein